jgi:hypothetical protein
MASYGKIPPWNITTVLEIEGWVFERDYSKEFERHRPKSQRSGA